jgi:hypothetical protein
MAGRVAAGGPTDGSGHNEGMRSVTLRIRKPAPGTPPPNRVTLPKPLEIDVDIVDLLLEERQNHR